MERQYRCRLTSFCKKKFGKLIFVTIFAVVYRSKLDSSPIDLFNINCVKKMWNLVIDEKNRTHFCNWFRKNAEDRNLFLRCYTDYLCSNGCSTSFIYDFPSLLLMADAIFTDMLGWRIQSVCLYPQLNECTFFFTPFSSVPEGNEPLWQKNYKIQRKNSNF